MELFVDDALTAKKDRASRQSEVPAMATPGSGRSAAPPRVKAEESFGDTMPVSAQLRCIKGPDTGATIALAEGVCRIGRARDNTFVLKDIASSRHHLELLVRGDRIRVVDLASGNGTRVNGQRVTETDVNHGDRIDLGTTVFELLWETQHPLISDEKNHNERQVSRTADKYAAELGDRPDDNDEVTARPPSKHGSPARAKNAKGDPTPALWNETFSNVPLNAVIPANERLRGGATSRVSTAPYVGDDPPLEPVSSFSTSRLPPLEAESPATTWLPFAAAAGVVVVLAIGAFAAYSLWRPNETPIKEIDMKEIRESEFRRALDGARSAGTRGDWGGAVEYAKSALQLKPDDAEARTTLAEALIGQSKMTPSRRKGVGGGDGAPLGTGPEPEPEPEPEPDADDVSEPDPAPEPARGGKKAGKTKGSRSSSAAKASMSDAEAEARFGRAIDAFRGGQVEKGCSIAREIRAGVSSTSTWRANADTLIARRCDKN